METENQGNHVFEFGFTDEAKSQITVLSQWMLINAITALVSLGVSVLSTINFFVKYSGYASNAMATRLPQMFISLVVSIILNVMLIQSSANLKKGVALNDQGHMNLGLSKMASYFKVLGILIIIMLVFVFLALLIIAL